MLAFSCILPEVTLSDLRGEFDVHKEVPVPTSRCYVAKEPQIESNQNVF